MSRGFAGFAHKILEDDHYVIYEYGAQNWNIPELGNKELICDGTITIAKSSLVEPVIHAKVKHWPNSRKETIEKRVPQDVDFSRLLAEGCVIVERSSYDKHDLYGCSPAFFVLIRKIYYAYQEQGHLPDKEGYAI